MPIMERTSSDDNRSLRYQCSVCQFVVRRPIARPGDREYNERVPCPRCLQAAQSLNRTREDEE